MATTNTVTGNQIVEVGKTLDSGYIVVPGIGTGAAYADGDAFGTTITFPFVVQAALLAGVVYTACYLDNDDEGLQVDLHLFKSAPTYVPTDNAAYSPADADNESYIGTISFSSFSNFALNQVSAVSNVGLAFAGAAGTSLYGQCVARGALNIAASNLPKMRLVVLAD